MSTEPKGDQLEHIEDWDRQSYQLFYSTISVDFMQSYTSYIRFVRRHKPTLLGCQQQCFYHFLGTRGRRAHDRSVVVEKIRTTHKTFTPYDMYDFEKSVTLRPPG